MIALIERCPRSQLYEIAFIFSVRKDGICHMMNPNIHPLQPGHRYTMHVTDFFPKDATIFRTHAALTALAETPEEYLGELDKAIVKAWNEIHLCSKCKETNGTFT